MAFAKSLSIKINLNVCAEENAPKKKCKHCRQLVGSERGRAGGGEGREGAAIVVDE